MSDAQTKLMEMMDSNSNKGNKIRPLSAIGRQLEDK
jgi:hypothetical protein